MHGRFLIVAGLALSASLLTVPQPARSQSTATTPEPLPIAKLFPTLTLDKWVGQKVQFLAPPVYVTGDLHTRSIGINGWMRVKTAADIEKETYRHGDVVERLEVTPNTSAPDYVKAMQQELGGKVATIVAVEAVKGEEATEKIVTVEVDQSKRRYFCVAYNGSLGNIVFLGERNAARRVFQGKTLYSQARTLLAFHGKEIVRAPIDNYAPVTVQDVVPSTDEYNPLRFLLRTHDGRRVFADVHLGATNIPPSLLEYDSFATTFVVTDPRKLYHWKPAIWAAIARRQSLAGMTPLQVTMAEGKPDHIDNLKAGQVWNYQESAGLQKVVFKYGKVHAILLDPSKPGVEIH